MAKWHISLNGVEVSKEIEGLVEPFRLPQFVLYRLSVSFTFFAALKKQKQDAKKRGSLVLMIAEVSDGDGTPGASQASFSILVL